MAPGSPKTLCAACPIQPGTWLPAPCPAPACCSPPSLPGMLPPRAGGRSDLKKKSPVCHFQAAFLWQQGSRRAEMRRGRGNERCAQERTAFTRPCGAMAAGSGCGTVPARIPTHQVLVGRRVATGPALCSVGSLSLGAAVQKAGAFWGGGTGGPRVPQAGRVPAPPGLVGPGWQSER